MSEGIWERQPNGDYIHFSNDEWTEVQKQRWENSKKITGFICALSFLFGLLILCIGIYFFSFNLSNPFIYISVPFLLIGAWALNKYPNELLRGLAFAVFWFGGIALAIYLFFSCINSVNEKHSKEEREEINLNETEEIGSGIQLLFRLKV